MLRRFSKNVAITYDLIDNGATTITKTAAPRKVNGMTVINYLLSDASAIIESAIPDEKAKLIRDSFGRQVFPESDVVEVDIKARVFDEPNCRYTTTSARLAIKL